MCSAWATSRPSRSKRAQEESRLSLIFGEKLERRRTTPISSATDVRAFLTISKVRGSSKSEAVLTELLGCFMSSSKLKCDDIWRGEAGNFARYESFCSPDLFGHS